MKRKLLKNRFVASAFLNLALCSLVFGQAASDKLSQEERTRNDLMQLERDIGKANIASDYAFF